LVDALWDDAAFKRRVERLAKQRGISVSEALKSAGITPRYFSRSSAGRSVNLIYNLARALNVSPNELLGLKEETKTSSRLDSDKLKCIAEMTRIVTAQLASIIYVWSDESGTDPTELAKRILSKVNGLKDQQSNNK
jgi:transcriptional regulator with XRE-family HTH domain